MRADARSGNGRVRKELAQKLGIATRAAIGAAKGELQFALKINLVAMVRVRASDEKAARKIVPTVLRAPDTTELRPVRFCVGP
jgi:hypothetical protein